MIEFRKTGEIRATPLQNPVLLRVTVDGETAETLGEIAHERDTSVAEIVRVGIRMILDAVEKESKEQPIRKK